MHGEGISTPTRPSQEMAAFNRVCKIMTSIFIYFPFLCFFIFWGRQEHCPCSYVSLSAMKNSNLHSSLKSKKVMCKVDFKCLKGSF